MVKYLFVLIVGAMVGCNNETGLSEDVVKSNDFGEYPLQLKEFEGCQYIIYAKYGVGATMVHHNNCKYCKERNKIVWDDYGSNEGLTIKNKNIKLGGAIESSTTVLGVDDSGFIVSPEAVKPEGELKIEYY